MRLLIKHLGNLPNTVIVDRTKCRVVIEDDGSGFEPTEAQLEDSEHFGLSIMHERAAAIGAELKVESEPGEGTTVFLEFDAPEMSAEPQRAEETR